MKIEKKHLLDYTILIPYLILSIVGLIVVYSTTSARLVAFGANPFASVMNQGAFWLVSLFSIFFIYRLKLNFLRKDKLLGVLLPLRFYFWSLPNFSLGKLMVPMVGLCLVPCLSNQRSTLRSLLFGFWHTLFQKTVCYRTL